MPTYEYRCKDCQHELEAVQGFHDDPLTECPSCGGALRKKFGSVGISFKGSGFYKNDSRSSSASTSSSSSSDSSTTSDTSSKDSGSTTSGSTTSGSSTSGSKDTGSKESTSAAPAAT